MYTNVQWTNYQYDNLIRRIVSRRVDIIGIKHGFPCAGDLANVNVLENNVWLL